MQPKLSVSQRPVLLVSHGDWLYAGALWRAFRRQGWRVRLLKGGPDLRRLVRLRPPTAAVLEADPVGESGWLTCAKLQWEQPDLPIYLVANQASAEKRRFADFVGARRLLARGLGARAVVDELIGAAQTI